MASRLSAMAAMAALFFMIACDTARTDDEGGRPKTDEEPSTPAATDGSNEEPAAEEAVDAGTGTTWTDLYRDLFGPGSPASCAGTGMCHGSPDESGARGSDGYVCASRDGCRESMLSLETGIVQASDSRAPEKSTLVATLRRRSAKGGIVGTMPKRPGYVFSRASIARIETWIRNGAPND